MIELPTFEMGLTSGDIFFEFRTSSEKPMVLLHSEGEVGDFIKVGLKLMLCTVFASSAIYTDFVHKNSISCYY